MLLSLWSTWRPLAFVQYSANGRCFSVFYKFCIKQLRRGCEKYTEISAIYDPEDAQTYSRLFVDDRHKVLYRALPKAASTTFYNLFYYSLGIIGQNSNISTVKIAGEKKDLCTWITSQKRSEIAGWGITTRSWWWGTRWTASCHAVITSSHIYPKKAYAG